MAKAKVKPYNFSHLPKLSSEHVHSMQALLRSYPQFSEEKGFGGGFLKTWGKDLNIQVDGRFIEATEISQGKFLHNMSSPCLGLVFQTEPQGGRILAELDYSLGRQLVDLALGGKGKPPEELVNLSPLEEGIFEFLVVKALNQLVESTTLLGPSKIRLIKIAHESKIMVESTDAEQRGISLKFFLGLKSKGGYFKVYFPHPLVEGLLLQPDFMGGIGAGDDPSERERHLSRASHVKTSLISEVGRVTLQESEMKQLEEGDVVLFDETEAQLGSHGIAGKTILRVGENPYQGLLAELVDGDKRLVVKVLDFYGGIE